MVFLISFVVIFCFTSIHYVSTSTHRKQETKKETTVNQIVQYMKDEDVSLEEDEFKTIALTVYEESKQYDLDYRLVLAMMKVESNFKYKAVSPQGARGLMQVQPSLAKFIAKDVGIHWAGARTLDEPDKNIKIGVHFFSTLKEDFDNNVNMALHAYNMGPTRLKEILTEKNKPDKTFSNRVLKEYRKNTTILPDP